MYNIHRKNNLARHLNKMRKTFPEEYNFFPRTWVLPVDANLLRNEFDVSQGQLSIQQTLYKKFKPINQMRSKSRNNLFII